MIQGAINTLLLLCAHIPLHTLHLEKIYVGCQQTGRYRWSLGPCDGGLGKKSDGTRCSYTSTRDLTTSTDRGSRHSTTLKKPTDERTERRPKQRETASTYI